MIIVWLAALGATIVVALFVALVYLFARKNRPEPRALAIWAGRLWLFNFLLDLLKPGVSLCFVSHKVNEKRAELDRRCMVVNYAPALFSLLEDQGESAVRFVLRTFE